MYYSRTIQKNFTDCNISGRFKLDINVLKEENGVFFNRKNDSKIKFCQIATLKIRKKEEKRQADIPHSLRVKKTI